MASPEQERPEPPGPPPAPEAPVAGGALGLGVVATASTVVEPTGDLPRRGGLRTLEALRDPNFRWFFAALFGNFTALNSQIFIRGWLTYELTGSGAALTVVTAANGIVGLFLAPLGGVIADRVKQKKSVVQACQMGNAIAALVIAALIATEQLAFVHLILAAFVQGALMNVMMPSRQALTPDLVPEERLTNAIALNTSGMNAARLLMPGLAGGLLAALGGGDGNVDPAKWVYLAMAGLYLWSVLGLFLVRVPDRPYATGTWTGEGAPSVMDELRSGIRYIWGHHTIRTLLAGNFAMVFFSMTYIALLPQFAKEVLGTEPDGLGLLQSVTGVGSLFGSLLIASLPDRRRGLILVSSALLLGIGLLAFSFSTYYWLSVAILAVVGIGQAGRMSLSNALVQSASDDAYRGRVMSIYMMEFSIMNVCMVPFGLLADWQGPQVAIGTAAVALIVTSVAFLLFVRLYREID